jgi:hypothetical protein
MDNQQNEIEIQKKISEEIMSEAQEYFNIAKEYRDKKWNDYEDHVKLNKYNLNF